MTTKQQNYGMAALLSVVLIMTAAAVSHASHTETLAEEPEAHNYISTPSGMTHVYKFTDDDGSKCYVAEAQRGIALDCNIQADK